VIVWCGFLLALVVGRSVMSLEVVLVSDLGTLGTDVGYCALTFAFHSMH